MLQSPHSQQHSHSDSGSMNGRMASYHLSSSQSLTPSLSPPPSDPLSLPLPPTSPSLSPSPLASSYPQQPSSSDVSALWERVADSALMSHLDSLYLDVTSVGSLPPACEQIHLGVVDAAQFRALMELLHSLGRSCQQQQHWDAEHTASGKERGYDNNGRLHKTESSRPMTGATSEVADSDTSSSSSFSASSGNATPPLSSLSPPSSDLSQASSPATAVSSSVSSSSLSLSLSPAHDSLTLPPSSSPSASQSMSAASSAPLSSSSFSRGRGGRSTVSPAHSSHSAGRNDRVVSSHTALSSSSSSGDRFCKPSRLITVYPSKPFLITPIHLERIYVTSRKAAESMSDEDKTELTTITVRWMGKPTADELFLVATDVCALINIRKSNTAKTVAQFADGEKVSMPVHCSSGKGSSTHILTVLTLAGVRRLLTTSRSVLATSLLEYLTRVAVHLQHFPHFVPVNDPTKPTVTPLKPEQQAQLVPNPAANGLSSHTLPSSAFASSSTALHCTPASAVTAPSVAEPSTYTALSYPSTENSTASASPAASTIHSPVAKALPSSDTDNTSHAEQPASSTAINTSGGGSHGVSPSSVTSSRVAEPFSSLAATSDDMVGWTVKREHQEVATGGGSGEQTEAERQKKRKADDGNTRQSEAQRQPPHRRQQPRQQQLQQADSTSSHSPLPRGDDSRTSMYAAVIPHVPSRTLSNEQQSLAAVAPDSPSAAPYSHYQHSNYALPLHYTHSPPFMPAQPPSMTFSEGAEMGGATYAPASFHSPYYPTTTGQHASYYLSPQHRPLTAPPMHAFAHHSMLQHAHKPADGYASSARQHSQQQTLDSASGMQHSPAAAPLPADSSLLPQHPSSAELAMLPPLYPPHSCGHCQNDQHCMQTQPIALSGGPYSGSQHPLSVSPTPMRAPQQPPMYHTPYSHSNQPTQQTALQPPPPHPPHSHSHGYYASSNPPPPAYNTTAHPAFHNARYAGQ